MSQGSLKRYLIFKIIYFGKPQNVEVKRKRETLKRTAE